MGFTVSCPSSQDKDAETASLASADAGLAGSLQGTICHCCREAAEAQLQGDPSLLHTELHTDPFNGARAVNRRRSHPLGASEHQAPWFLPKEG